MLGRRSRLPTVAAVRQRSWWLASALARDAGQLVSVLAKQPDQPLPQPLNDGRWTVDLCAPSDRVVVNAGIRVRFRTSSVCSHWVSGEACGRTSRMSSGLGKIISAVWAGSDEVKQIATASMTAVGVAVSSLRTGTLSGQSETAADSRAARKRTVPDIGSLDGRTAPRRAADAAAGRARRRGRESRAAHPRVRRRERSWCATRRAGW